MLTGILYIDWAALALSLFNTILLVWLGLTVLLNAERRSWGIWLTGGGLLVGGAFFLSHSAIFGHSQSDLEPGLNIWWHVGWIPAILSRSPGILRCYGTGAFGMIDLPLFAAGSSLDWFPLCCWHWVH